MKEYYYNPFSDDQSKIDNEQEIIETYNAGAKWLIDVNAAGDGRLNISPLGIRVADLLGELFNGLYHIDPDILNEINWGNDTWIDVCLPSGTDLTTWDSNKLTKLVLLAHYMAIRVQIEPVSLVGRLRIIFHQRLSRTGPLTIRHPSIEEAIRLFNFEIKRSGIPQFADHTTPEGIEAEPDIKKV